MSSTFPSVLIIPGAWHPSSLYEGLVDKFEQAGFSATTADLPSLDSSDPGKATCVADADSIRETISALIEKEEKDLILLAHSYGGMPCGAAARGLSSRENGKLSGVVGLIYLAGVIVPEGESLIGCVGGENPPCVVEDNPIKDLSTVAGSRDVMYNDLDPETAGVMEKALLPHALTAFSSHITRSAWAETVLDGRRAFVKCTQDRAIPPLLQDMFVERSGVQWLMRDLDASHSAFVSKPEELAKVVYEIWELWAQQ